MADKKQKMGETPQDAIEENKSSVVTSGASTAAEPAIDDTRSVKMLKEARETILAELRKVIVGQEEVVELMLIAIFSRGHSLLMGVPALQKL